MAVYQIQCSNCSSAKHKTDDCPRLKPGWEPPQSRQTDMRDPAVMQRLLVVKGRPENHLPLGEYCPDICMHRR